VRRLTPTRRRYIRAHIVNSLAGRAAECRHLIAYGREPSRSFVGSYDWDAVLRANFMAGRARWRLSSLRREAERLVRENWDRVVAVAEALLERRRLSGDELRALLEQVAKRHAVGDRERDEDPRHARPRSPRPLGWARARRRGGRPSAGSSSSPRWRCNAMGVS